MVRLNSIDIEKKLDAGEAKPYAEYFIDPVKWVSDLG